MICEICKEEVSVRGIGTHLTIKHGISSEEYYTKYIGEVKYCRCGKKATFKFSTGYTNYCCRQHYFETPEYIEANKKISESYKTRDMDAWMTKRKETNIKKYGVEHVSQLENHYEKSCKTQIEKYGELKTFSNDKQRMSAEASIQNNLDVINSKRRESYWNNEEKKLIALSKRKETNLSTGMWTERDETEYLLYRKIVRKLTRRNIKMVYDTWDGTDYYTKENITTIPKCDVTIDHKISILYGFLNNIPHSEISKIENLCICSREVNSRKNKKIEYEFKKEMEHKKKSLMESIMVEE